METEGLSIICAGIGYADEDENGALVGYTKGEHCLDNLKDLQRFLRRDDPQRRDVFHQICKWNTVSRDLVPIIEHHQNDRNLVISAVKILVFLTMPIDHSSDNVLQQTEHLWDLKAALARPVTISVIVSLLEDPLDHLEHNTFTEDDWKLVQLVLTLFRNTLAIHDITLQQKSAGSATQFLCLTDRFLELMFQENVMDLILVLTQHVNDSSGYLQQDNLLLLESFYYVFLGREPELIAKFSKRTTKESVNEEITTSVNSLRSIMEEEAEKRRIMKLKNLERHSQFSGTFTRLGVDGSKTLFKRNPTSAYGNGLSKVHNIQRGPLKRIAWDHVNLPSAKENILELLHEFLNQFLSGGYNVLMQSIYEDIVKECQSIQKTDILMFFQVAKFVLSFQHQKILIAKESNVMEPISDPSLQNLYANNISFHGDVCGPVAATINEVMFSFVTSKWLEAFEGLKQTNDYKSLSVAGSLFKNMIRMLDIVLKVLPEDSRETQTARVLLYKLFYDQTDQGLTHFLLNMFKSFNTHKQPRSDLADLLEVIHIMLRLMEKLQARGALRVAKKSRKGRRKKIAKDIGNTEAVNVREEMNLESADDQTDATGRHTPEALIDSNNPGKKQPAELNLADQVVQEEDTLISNQTPVLHDMQNRGHVGDGMMSLDDETVNDNVIGNVHEPTDSSSDDQVPETNEVDFNISQLVSTFSNNNVVHNLCWLLKYYKSNSINTNHYIICMLRRICEDLDISPMLYQLSILRVFHEILYEQKTSASKEYTTIVNFLTKFLRKMLKLMKERPLLFVEVLFWKTRRECHCITADALIANLTDMKKDTRNLPNDGVCLTSDTRPKQKSIADSLGDDEFIIPHDINISRDENLSDGFHEYELNKAKQSVSEKNSMKYITNENSEVDERSYSRNASKWRKGYFFDVEQEITMKNLYQKYKDDRNCSRLIAEALDPEGNITPVQVYRKLKQLGLLTVKRKKSAGADVLFSSGEILTEEAAAVLTSISTPSSPKEKGKHYYDETSLRRRRRIQAFSKEQELEIKVLFERFKHHKKCSRMIAEALGADNTYTAAQVSRKLKQLGLVASKETGSSEAGMQSRNEVNGEKIEQSDETVLSIKQSHKKKKPLVEAAKSTSMSQHLVMPMDDYTGEETLRNLFIKRRKRSKSSAIEVTRENKSPHKVLPSEHDSDNEILTTLFKGRAKRHSDQPTENEIGNGGLASLSELLKPSQQSERPQKDEIDTVGLSIMDDDGNMMGNTEKGVQHGEFELDYVDSEDELSSRSLPQKTSYKRNVKLVIDDEDDL